MGRGAGGREAERKQDPPGFTGSQDVRLGGKNHYLLNHVKVPRAEYSVLGLSLGPLAAAPSNALAEQGKRVFSKDGENY